MARPGRASQVLVERRRQRLAVLEYPEPKHFGAVALKVQGIRGRRRCVHRLDLRALVFGEGPRVSIGVQI
jgi:hypothetical protein